jgi:hypothetical protein
MKRIAGIALVLTAAAQLSAANWPERPQLVAVRVSPPPVLDGDLSDPAWQNAPEFTDFTQHEPVDGAPATMPTSVRIVYDDDAIYFGAKMVDPQPPTSLLVRRDSFSESDFLSIHIDAQLDRVTGATFTVTPANTQIDSALFNDIKESVSWDAVWESATRITSDGWIAEVRIPFSQLRFPDREKHVWGLNVTRRTVRNNELVRIVNTRKEDTGFVSHFADIVGIEGIRRGRSLELTPYGVVRADARSGLDPAHPLLERQDQRFDGGLDLKYALTSSLTLTGTINPDFGQVEVDPAVVNLTEFETFFPEKRPFFTEGVGIFQFDNSPAPSRFNFTFPPQVFYSRRIGRTPQVRPDAEFVDVPASTTILGAAKLTGSLPGGWTIGVLDAVTAREDARFASRGTFGNQPAEPLTNYFVGRATKSIGARGRIGIITTAVNRELPSELAGLRESSYSGGLDAFTRSPDNAWMFEGSLLGSRVEGSASAIANTQREPGHYYQRPDAGHVVFDPTRTSLEGWGARGMVSKVTGLWRPNVQVQAFSPGLETNDVGFMQRADIISGHAFMQYLDQNVTSHFRQKNVWFGGWQNSNFDGDTLRQGVMIDHSATLANYWTYGVQMLAWGSAVSDRLTRGGPVVTTPPGWQSRVRFATDSRERYTIEISADAESSGDGSEGQGFGIGLSARPMPNLSFSVKPSVSRSYSRHQFIRSLSDPSAAQTYGRRYVFGEIDRRSFEVGTRVDWTVTPRLSFQLFLQPFIASGDYHDLHSLVAPRTRDYEPYAGSVAEPDFNFRSVRGSAVARWEFRPGSALYVVWNENRAETAPIGDFQFGRDLRAISTAPSHDVFLVKVSYWMPF